MKKIYCVGDSHSSIFSGQNIIVPSGYWTEYSDFKIFHAGPFTAFNCNKKDVVINECNSVPKDDFILLSFGEIDMRCRVGLAEDKHANIDLIIKNYFNLIDRIDNKNIIILGVTPCIVEEPMKDWFSADETRKFIFTATRGTLVERNSYKEYFNNCVNKMCKKKDYIFIDFWDHVFNKVELYKDDVHLDGSKTIGIIKEIINSKIGSI